MKLFKKMNKSKLIRKNIIKIFKKIKQKLKNYKTT